MGMGPFILTLGPMFSSSSKFCPCSDRINLTSSTYIMFIIFWLDRDRTEMGRELDVVVDWA